MPPAIKFCGLTRPDDAARAAKLGAGYVGVILAGGPRALAVARAREVYAAAAGEGVAPRRVGVFATGTADSIADAADEAGIDVVQLHCDPDPEMVPQLRERFRGDIWSVVRTDGDVPEKSYELFDVSDAIVLDKLDARLVGGTGRSFDWSLAARWLAQRRPKQLVLAGGLRAANVRDAIQLLRPDVVDVSSGVESSIGIKDHALMEAFAAAVAGARE
ncbi:MAG TPA: phosphoribosylanthranilate isomerase [Gemmatimonadaceae bacterium]|nr:phosphoribosylanthranilate isomerase [Gemmatimonadaceae bacterium]